MGLNGDLWGPWKAQEQGWRWGLLVFEGLELETLGLERHLWGLTCVLDQPVREEWAELREGEESARQIDQAQGRAVKSMHSSFIFDR